MAKRRLEPHTVQQAWTASGAISAELSPKPYTITRMVVNVRYQGTSATPTHFNDPWDRIISRLNLTGAGRTFFDLTNLRPMYHLSRYAGFGPKRPQPLATGATTDEQYFSYIFHFGVAPYKVNPISGMLDDNPWDLTGGILPSGSGNLTLGGTFSASDDVMGTNVDITDADLEVYLYGVQPEAGDPADAWMPRAFPSWQMQTPTPTSTSGQFATQHNIPAGDHLHSMLIMTTRDTNAPRDDGVLSSLEVFNQLESRSILKYGGFGSNFDIMAAQLISQHGTVGNVPPSEAVATAMDGLQSSVPGTITVNGTPSDSGLIYLPLYRWGGHPLYGVDLRGVATGDLQLRYGVITVTTITMDVLYRKYSLNRDHPANAGA